MKKFGYYRNGKWIDPKRFPMDNLPLRIKTERWCAQREWMINMNIMLDKQHKAAVTKREK